MKARPAVLSDSMLGASFVVVGVAAFVIAATRAQLEFDSFVVWIIAMFVWGAVIVAAVSVRQLLAASTLPESVTLSPWYAVAGRVFFSAAVPLAAIIYASTWPAGTSWVLGVGCVILGVTMCGIATLAARIERRYGAQVVRVDNRYFLTR